MTTNASMENLDRAMLEVNKLYADNIRFKNIKRINRDRVRFTLSIHNSRNPGARRSPSGRRVAAACWHVHGCFFDALLSVNPNAFILTCRNRIDRCGGNWVDYNIGSIANPMRASAACNCPEAHA